MHLQPVFEADQENPVTRPFRVLVIDHDDVDRRMVRRFIGNHCDMLEARSGDEGLALYRDQSPDCVLLNHALPETPASNTFDKLIRQRAAVILLTGDGDDEEGLRAVGHGAQDFLDKNLLNENMLKRVIRYAIERNRMTLKLHRSMGDLEKSEQRFNEMAAHIDHGLWVWSTDGRRFIYQNPAADRIYGRTMDEWNDIDWYEVLHPDDREAEIERARRCEDDKCEHESILRVVHPNGDVRHVEQSSFPILDRNGEVERIIGICRDVTERKKLEQELRLAQKLEAVGQLAAGVAHEINTPSQYVSDNVQFLTDAFDDLMPVLRGYGELLAWAGQSAMPPSDLERLKALSAKADLEYLLDEMPVALKQSRDGLDQIKKIVRAMKDFSHPGDEMESTDLNHAIESTTTVARNEWKYVAEVDLQLDPDLPRVVCVPSAVNQVILNLIVNAAHAIGDVVKDDAGKKGVIRIATSAHGEHAVVEISDTGCGIPQQICDRVFDPFFTTKEVGKGTGQGLAIARNVVTERHNGTIEVQSTEGEGTTFTIKLPIDGQCAQESEAAA